MNRPLGPYLSVQLAPGDFPRFVEFRDQRGMSSSAALRVLVHLGLGTVEQRSVARGTADGGATEGLVVTAAVPRGVDGRSFHESSTVPLAVEPSTPPPS